MTAFTAQPPRRPLGLLLACGLFFVACGEPSDSPTSTSSTGGSGLDTGGSGLDTGGTSTSTTGEWSDGNVVHVGDVATTTWMGPYVSHTGAALAVGDLNGDAQPELLVGAPYSGGYEGTLGLLAGRAYVVDPLGAGGALEDGSLATLGLDDGDMEDSMGDVLAAGVNLDGDGYGDLVLGLPRQHPTSSTAGVCYIVHGPVLGDVWPDLTPETTVLASSDYQLADSVAVGDLLGDGNANFSLQVTSYPSFHTEPGQVWVFDGAATGTLSVDDALAQFLGEEGGDSLRQGSQVGDFDGDGVADSAFGAAGYGSQREGRAYVVLGPSSGAISMADADRVVTSDRSYSDFGMVVVGVGDLDGDGLADVMVGAYTDSTLAERAGSAVMIQGGTLGVDAMDDAPVSVAGENEQNFMGYAFAPHSDIDSDGQMDLVVSAPYSSNGSPGLVYVFPGPLAGVLDPALDSSVVLQGEFIGDGFGISLAASDIDGDGATELMIGAPGRYDIASYSGEVYLVPGLSLVP